MTETARIARTHLGPEDHGILTALLHLEGDGWGQGFGGYNLAAQGEAARWITGLLRTFEREKWEDLKGQYCRVRREGNGISGRIIAIGHIVNDKWFTA